MGKLLSAYAQISPSRIGDPLEPQTLIGPLHSPTAVATYFDVIQKIKQQGGEILFGGERAHVNHPQFQRGNFVLPTISSVTSEMDVVQHEHFVPILHTLKFKVRRGVHLTIM